MLTLIITYINKAKTKNNLTGFFSPRKKALDEIVSTSKGKGLFSFPFLFMDCIGN